MTKKKEWSTKNPSFNIFKVKNQVLDICYNLIRYVLLKFYLSCRFSHKALIFIIFLAFKIPSRIIKRWYSYWLFAYLIFA
jgi:hypothetical protein